MTFPRSCLAQLLGHTPLHGVGCQQDRLGRTLRDNLDKQGTGEEGAWGARGLGSQGKVLSRRVTDLPLWAGWMVTSWGGTEAGNPGRRQGSGAGRKSVASAWSVREAQ